MRIEIVFTHERIAVPPLHWESREAGACVEAFHFFPFGGLAKTSAWIKGAMEG